MCTYAFHVDPQSDWPFVIAGNRDESLSRQWHPPAEHWGDRPGVVAGKDLEAGGSWAGMNDHGVVACLLNRWDTLGPAAGKRSRGEIVLDALDFADASEAVQALSQLDPDAFRGFNLIVADNRDCFWVRLVEGKGESEDGRGGLSIHAVPRGTHVLSHGDLDDITARRIERFLPQFAFLGAPLDPQQADHWQPWRDLLNTSTLDPISDPKSALRVSLPEHNFGTGSQSFMALHSVQTTRPQHPGVYWFARPDDPLSRVL